MKLSVGTKVRWTSQAGGIEKVKEGVVVAILPPGCPPWRHKNWGTLTGTHRTIIDGKSLSRGEESYFVAVAPERNTARAKPWLYWPRVSALEVLP